MLQTKPKTTLTLLGNEAIAHGLADGGIKFAAAYPGTPSTEIMEALILKFKDRMIADWSSNEVVAMEESAAAAIAGTDAAVMMKSVGLNVAMDPVMTMSLTGVNAALVIVVADDPGMHSSQNEQDNRFMSNFSGFPMFEPRNVQQCYDFAREAVLVSRKFQIPVFFRSVTRISHELGIIQPGIPAKLDPIIYEKNPSRYVNIPGNARPNKVRTMAMQEALFKYAQKKKYFDEFIFGNGKEYLIVTSGSSASYALDVFKQIELNATILIPHLINPFPEDRFLDLVQNFDNVIVIEELDPFFENKIINLIYRNKLKVEVFGKKFGITPPMGELTGEVLMSGLSKLLQFEYQEPKKLDESSMILLKMRPPVLCAGCPHRSSYVLLQKALKRQDVFFANDIGCYSLGVLPPHNSADTLIAMGASIPMATAVSFTQPDKTAVAVIGDSTFWHSGVSGLANAIWKKANITIVIMDNLSTAMTGDQPNPSILESGSNKPALNIEETVKGMGAWVKVFDPMNFKEVESELKDIVAMEGVKVVVMRHLCALVDVRQSKKVGKTLPLVDIVEENCNGCKLCISPVGCPALNLNEFGLAEVNPDLCNGCKLCMQHCKRDAIIEVERK